MCLTGSELISADEAELNNQLRNWVSKLPSSQEGLDLACKKFSQMHGIPLKVILSFADLGRTIEGLVKYILHDRAEGDFYCKERPYLRFIQSLSFGLENPRFENFEICSEFRPIGGAAGSASYSVYVCSINTGGWAVLGPIDDELADS